MRRVLWSNQTRLIITVPNRGGVQDAAQAKEPPFGFGGLTFRPAAQMKPAHQRRLSHAKETPPQRGLLVITEEADP
jgi:hypothetical protein